MPGVEAPPPTGPGKVVRLRQATIERLAALTGRAPGEDLDGQVGAVAADLATARALLHRAEELAGCEDLSLEIRRELDRQERRGS